MSEDRATLSAAARKSLPDSAFAYIDEKGGRHFPIHDKAHVQAALRLGPRSPMWSKAKGKVMAAAKKHGVNSEDSGSGRSLESLFPEVRFIADRPELRRSEPTGPDDDGARHITGYASVFGKVSRKLGGFHEKVMDTAFTAALRKISAHEQNVNIVCRYNHKDDMVLGTTMADTLRLAVDEKGLRYDVRPPNHRDDVMELVERGDVRYSSFAFRVPVPGEDDTWGESEYGLPMRSLHNVELVDVAPVLDPAYFDTEAHARNITGAIESLAAYVGASVMEVRSVMEAGQTSRFFKRTDRPSTPSLDSASAEQREESRVLDDATDVLRSNSEVPDEPESDEWTSLDERTAPDAEETRAALKNMEHGKLCKQWTDGQPCVRPAGHPAAPDEKVAGAKMGDEDGHAPLCWSHKSGLPCAKPLGHEGEHEPLNVKTRDAEDAADAPEEHRTDSPREALTRLFDAKAKLTQLPE